MPYVADSREDASGRPALRLSHAIMFILFGLVLGRLVWRVTGEMRHAETAGAASHFTAVDVRGRRITLPKAPVRIVSLTPANTEILFALNLGGRVVADTAFCDYPPEARKLPHIGDMTTSVEKVVAQRPDLVLASVSANGKAIGPLERARIPVFAVDPKSVAETYATILSIGQLTGRKAEAERLVNGMKAREAAVTRIVARDTRKPKVLAVLQMNPLWVVGSGNFIDEMIVKAGAQNIAADSGAGYHTYSPELVAARRPDVILVNPESAAEVRSRAGWGGVPAIRNHAVYTIDPAMFTRPGPRLADAQEVVARLLHPRAFAARP